MTIERLLTTAETAEMLGMTPTWLNHARLQGKGPHYVRIGRLVKYRPADVRAFIEQNLIEANS